MPKIAWAKQLYNAYNHIKKGEKVYDKDGNLMGVADGCYTRCTATSPGSVCLGGKKFISGNVEKCCDGKWKVV